MKCKRSALNLSGVVREAASSCFVARNSKAMARVSRRLAVRWELRFNGDIEIPSGGARIPMARLMGAIRVSGTFSISRMRAVKVGK